MALVERISWPAIIAGAVIALAIQVLLAMLGTGVSASTVDSLANGDWPTASAFGNWLGGMVVRFKLDRAFFSGWMAGRLSGMLRSADGGLHGLLTWAVVLLAMVYLVGTVERSLMSAAAGILGTAATATAIVGAAAAPKIADAAGEQISTAGILVDSLKREAMPLLSQTGKPGLQPDVIAQQAGNEVSDVKQTAGNPVGNDHDFSSLIEQILRRGKGTVSQVDKDAVVNVVVARIGLPRDQASKRVDGWMNTADQSRAKAAQASEQAKQKAREVVDATAKGVSRALLLSFLALAIGALAAF